MAAAIVQELSERCHGKYLNSVWSMAGSRFIFNFTWPLSPMDVPPENVWEGDLSWS
jgi:hypothetical protein